MSVQILGITAVLERIYHDPNGRIPYHYVLVDFLCDFQRGELRPASDITAAQFVSLAALPQFALPQFTAHVIHRAWTQKQQGSFLPVME